MKAPREALAIRQAAERLADIFGASELAEDVDRGVRTRDSYRGDAVFSIRGHSFVLEWKRSGSLGPIATARFITQGLDDDVQADVVGLAQELLRSMGQL